MPEEHGNRLHLLVKGRVQGVGFRFFVYQTGLNLLLRGWVRNIINGDVEILAEGPRKKLNLLIREVRKGPRMAEIIDIDLSWDEPVGDLPPFTILNTK